MRNAWIKQSEKTLLQSNILDLIVRTSRSDEKNRTHDFYLMRSNDWSNIIPITENGTVVMVKQYRVGIEEFTLEIPGGVVDSTDPSAEAGAIREMIEETGYAPRAGARCERLLWTHPNPAILNNRCHSFVVGPVRKKHEQQLDPSEMIEVIELPIEEVPARILNGEITHALMLNAFFFLSLKSSLGSQSLLNELRRFVR